MLKYLFLFGVLVTYGSARVSVGPSVAIGPFGAAKNLFSEFKREVEAAKTHLIAGATARGVSIFAMYPLDTIKTRMQLPQIKRSALPVLSLATLFKGAGGSLIGQIPYGMLTFGSYEVYKKKLVAKFPETGESRPEGLFLLAAILGDLTGSLWLCPSEVVKQQIQSGLHNDLRSAIRSIAGGKNGLLGFYRGYAGQVSRDVPFRAIQLPTYEIVKREYVKRFGSPESRERGTLKAREATVVGAVAGSISAAITTPLDVIKTRLQTGSMVGSPPAVALRIAREEGLAGLYAGIGPRVVYIGPSCALFFVVYEATKEAMLNRGGSL